MPSTRFVTRAALMACAAMALSACAADQTGPQSASSSAARSASPYPSTYAPYPGRPTALVGATLFDGRGGQMQNATVLFENGRITAVGDASLGVPAGYDRIDGTGKFVTPGVIDIHSHLGDYPSPDVALQILPGSANLMGGRSVTLKNVPALTVQGMKFPGAPQGLKMACGENPKRVYGGKGQAPSTRMGNFAVNRQTWIDAQDYDGTDRNLAKDTLKAVLDGEIQVHNHCYRADEMALVIDMAKEFGYTVSTFHHAVESYKIADLLRENDICSAVWADWWGFKMEAYDGILENAALIENAGACVVIHSDDQDGIQRLNQEAAKAQAAGKRIGIDIPDGKVIGWFTYNAAKAMGIADETGSLETGKAADVVLWNGNPLSVYSRPEKVWIDGALMFDANDPKRRPVSDFELGQPGAGDVK